MKYEYPEIETVNHDGARWYDTPAGWMPSITTILGATESAEKIASLEKWREGIGRVKADFITQHAAERGTAVHLLAERFLKGQVVEAPIDGKEIRLEDIASFRALKPKLGLIDEVWGQEAALFSKSIEIAGRADVIGKFKGIESIIDFKTSRRIKSDDDIFNYKIQLCFYALAHNEMFETDIQQGVVLMVSEQGFPQEFKFELRDYHDILVSKAAKYWQIAINKCN